MTLDADAKLSTEGNKQPLYAHIASELQQRIVDGRYPISSLLPAETELTEEFATSRNTIREALRVLVERGMLRRRQGSGTVVISTTSSVKYVQSFTSLEDLFANSRDTYYALHSIAAVALDSIIAERIGAIAGEQWLLVTGVRWTAKGGNPISFIESYIPMEFKATVDSFWDLNLPFYAVLEQASGCNIDEVVQEIRAVEMPRRVANAWGCRKEAHLYNCCAVMWREGVF